MNECKASCGGGNAPARSPITPVKIAAAIAAALSLATPSSVLAAASSNEGGEYAYAGSPTDNRTTGQTGDQTYTISAPITVNNFWPGQNDSSDYWQIYKGAAITGTGNTRIMSGNVVLENALVWSGNNENYVGYTGPVKLLLRSGGSLTATKYGLRIGQSYNNGTAGTATVFMEEPSALVGAGQFVSVGNQLPGALWMDGGTVSVTNAILFVGEGTKTSDGGFVRLDGGEISLRSDAGGDAARIGSQPSYSSIHVSGGEISSRKTSPASETFVKVGSAANTAADFYMDGGLADFWNERPVFGYWNTSQTGSRASLTVDGDAVFRAYLLVLGRAGSGNAAAVNLKGGRLEITRGFSTYGNTSNGKRLNFDGGTLALVKDSRAPLNVGSVDAEPQSVVFPGGATIDIDGVEASVSASPRAAAGWGVSEIRLTNPGSGYVTAPKVEITGGSGAGVTAYAVLRKDRTLEKIVVTCRGEGYSEGDAVEVAISSATGSGAAATATLAPNAGGTVRKTGSGSWVQTANDNAFDGEIEIAEGSLVLDGTGFTSASAMRMDGGTALKPVKGKSSTMNRLDAANGIVEIRAQGATGTARLDLGPVSADAGLVLVTHTNGLSLSMASADSSAAGSVVNGLAYAARDSSGYRSPSLFARGDDGSLSLVETSATPGENANWCPSGSGTFAVSAVESVVLPLSPRVDAYVESADLVEVKSGMFVCRRPHEDLVRMQVTGGGAFTTRAGNGMIVYGDNYLTGKRSNSTADGNAVHCGSGRRIFGPFADPDGSTAMRLTVAGEKQARPELGAQAWLVNDQRFSGGLDLVNGGVFVQSDLGLGAAGGRVRTSGYCSIAAYNTAFDIAAARTVELLDGSALVFSPAVASGNTVAAALAGSGDLLTSDVNRPSCVVSFTGDHSAFVGDYYVQGRARIAPAAFSPLAGICLADGTNGVGVIEASGAFTRPAGTGKGEIRWKRFAAYPSTYGLRGGFAAFGGDLTVDLGGEGAALAPGSDYLPEGAVIQLQSQYADGALVFRNGFDLGGRTQKVNVWPGKTATIAGAISDAAGGGSLDVDGNVTLAGALEIAAANVASEGPLVAVDGDLEFGDGATLSVDAAVLGEIDLVAGYAVATCTGTVSGTPALAAATTAAGWYLHTKNGSLLLRRQQPFVMIVR